MEAHSTGNEGVATVPGSAETCSNGRGLGSSKKDGWGTVCSVWFQDLGRRMLPAGSMSSERAIDDQHVFDSRFYRCPLLPLS